MEFLAHITEIDGQRVNQTLRDHCINTAKYASQSMNAIGFYHMAYLAGLLHDMGKATEKFQRYLEDAYEGKPVVRGSVNHTFAGVIFLLERYHGGNPYDKMVSEIISYAIGAHHGLFDCVDLEGNNGYLHRLDKDRKEICYEEALENYLSELEGTSLEEIDFLFAKAVEEFKAFFAKTQDIWKKDSIQKQKVFFEIGLLARLVLSTVIYGDRRDTREFMNGINAKEIEGTCPDSQFWQKELSYFEDKISRFDETSEINKVRKEISQQCLYVAQRPTGIYRLNVPTGGGKTLSTLRYALAHACKFNKERIIFIIPLLSILDQNAKVIREYLQTDNTHKSVVLEHHSNVMHELHDLKHDALGQKNVSETGDSLDIYETLTETWDAPVIISTLVQLLDILFSHKTSSIGRMRALCNSVIVIDEVQSIPKKTIAMFDMALNFLSRYCNATIVLSSATQPCLEETKWPVLYADMPDLVRLHDEQIAVFERAEIIDKTTQYGMDLDECASLCDEVLQGRDSLLVICNTKKEARTLFEKFQTGNDDYQVFHLSTSMCQVHRMRVLDAIQENLRKVQAGQGQKVVCISTQLVEAGVDFSFECVVRIMAGIDNLVQATGRCNRSNEYGRKGTVYLVNLKNENLRMLKEISDAKNSTRLVLEKKKQQGLNGSCEDTYLVGEWAITEFYRNLYQEKEFQKVMKYPYMDGKSSLYLTELLANHNAYAKEDGFYLKQPFKTVAQHFEVFDQETYDVFVPYGTKGQELYAELSQLSSTSANIMRHNLYQPLKKVLQLIKGYTVSIYRWQMEKLLESGLLTGIFEDRVWVLSLEAYDEKFGLNDRAELKTESFIL